MIVRAAKVEDLPNLATCAAEFYASSSVLKQFDIARFCDMWTGLLVSGVGAIFLIEDREIVGTIGGLAYPDPYSGIPIATEFFWYVRESHRGGGVRLYRAFEKWARSKGCTEIRMVHLVDSMPEKLETFYARTGYKRAEVHWVKDLS